MCGKCRYIFIIFSGIGGLGLYSGIRIDIKKSISKEAQLKGDSSESL